MLIVDEAVVNVVEQLRAAVQMRCPKTLLSSLMQSSRRQRLENFTHPFPSA
jgi:hypothetical protein